jgi:hypothetical protein
MTAKVVPMNFPPIRIVLDEQLRVPGWRTRLFRAALEGAVIRLSGLIYLLLEDRFDGLDGTLEVTALIAQQ